MNTSLGFRIEQQVFGIIKKYETFLQIIYRNLDNCGKLLKVALIKKNNSHLKTPEITRNLNENREDYNRSYDSKTSVDYRRLFGRRPSKKPLISRMIRIA